MSNDKQQSLVNELVELFRERLDEGLVITIAGDYDLQKSSEYDAASAILQGIADDAACEEATGFNPSGIAVEAGNLSLDDDKASATTSSHTAHTPNAGSSSTGKSSSTTEQQLPVAAAQLTAGQDDPEEAKLALLRGIFPGAKPSDVKYALDEAKGDSQAALDILLVIQDLQSSGQWRKDGLDYIETEMQARRKHKGKGKQKSRRQGTSNSTSDQDDSSYDSTDDTKHQQDVAYLVDRLNMPWDQVFDIYRKNRFSIGATAIEILDQHIAEGSVEALDLDSKNRADELAQKYRTVPSRYMPAIVQATATIPQFSEDMAVLLKKHFTMRLRGKRVDVAYTLAPLPKDEIEGSPAESKSKWTANTPTAGPSDHVQAARLAQNYRESQRDSYQSGSGLFRRGGSNHLYKQAAGFYFSRAREQGMHARQATSAAADQLVSQQSTAGKVDLHGVSVQDGVRITRQRLSSWWQGLEEPKARAARERSLTLVTGLGRHSVDGVSRLRQAVKAELDREGWKYDVETGRFVVRGR